MKQEDNDAVFYLGGHGPKQDLAEDKNSIKLIKSFLAAGKFFALVCHAPGTLRHVKPRKANRIQGKNLTGFADGDEEDVGLTTVVPFFVQGELIGLGATFSKVKNRGVHTVKDGQLISGRNPASSGLTAKLLIKTLTPKLADSRSNA